jgi:hypothetical protein
MAWLDLKSKGLHNIPGVPEASTYDIADTTQVRPGDQHLVPGADVESLECDGQRRGAVGGGNAVGDDVKVGEGASEAAFETLGADVAAADGPAAGAQRLEHQRFGAGVEQRPGRPRAGIHGRTALGGPGDRKAT